jgi:hypothetical protein
VTSVPVDRLVDDSGHKGTVRLIEPRRFFWDGCVKEVVFALDEDVRQALVG